MPADPIPPALPGDTLQPPKLLLGLVAASAVAHGGLAVVSGALWAQVLSGVLCAAALVIVALLIARPVPHVVLGTAVFGMLGVASFLGVLGAALATGGHPVSGWVGPWGIAAVIVDSSVVRISAAVLRRAENAARKQG
ncbi:hypothetical protein LWC33_11905 [Pseudonocardia sp. RS11V-5]|uniref:hypothetical protein n=1 Tax=Pseudonocardia terrae TaxID=2905831 RepID=UPI001E6087CA|nr:hypothetical protein [Pseudonocardia terrae]MCE3552161.1 hypothetical protein [Pseudonocardia terrae]